MIARRQPLFNVFGIVSAIGRCYAVPVMQVLSTEEDVVRAVRELVDRYRATCLWFLRPDYYPSTPAETWRTLQQIKQHGDRQAFVEASEVQQWLSLHSSAQSANS